VRQRKVDSRHCAVSPFVAHRPLPRIGTVIFLEPLERVGRHDDLPMLGWLHGECDLGISTAAIRELVLSYMHRDRRVRMERPTHTGIVGYAQAW